MVILLVLGLAWAGPGPLERAPRWEALPKEPESRGVLEDRGEVRLARVPGPEPLRAQCPPGEVPRRLAVLDGGLVDGPFSVPVRDESGWVFPPAPQGLGTWLVTPATCDLYRLDTSVPPEALAHAEWRRTAYAWRALVDLDPAFPAEEMRWISADPTLERYVAIRPAGPQPPGWTYWSGEGDHEFTVRGPRRLRIEARWIGEPRPICLSVDGVPACESTAPEEHLAVRGGHLARVPEVRDTEAVGRVASWIVLLPDGPHTLSVDGPAEVTLVGTWPVSFTRGDGLIHPEAVAVFPDAGPDPRVAVSPDGTPGSIVLLGPVITPIAPSDIRWVPLDDPGLASATRVDETGVLTLHLLPESDGPCTVRLPDGSSWRARPREAVQRFLWTGADDAPGWPTVEGCDARVRVTGLSEAEGAWVAGKWWAANPGGSIAWTSVGGEPRLFLRHPATQDRPYRVQITHPSGRVDHWTVDPRDVPGDRWTLEGAPWQPSLDVGLEPGPGEARVWSEVPLLVRLTAVGDEPSVPVPVPVPVPDPTPVEEPTAGNGNGRDLRSLAREIATAPDNLSRAQALLDRAAVFDDDGYVRLAWTDLERAAALDPTLADDNPVTDRLRRVTAALVQGTDRWVPDDPIWVPADAPAGVDERASKGDWLGVATQMRAAGIDPRIWWREAIVSGQIATADQRLDAYEDLVRYTPATEIEHPWLWPLRVLSGWERLVQVRGAAAQTAPWPEIASDDPDLFPDEWPADEIVDIPDGFELAIPKAGGRTLPVRCLATRLEVPEEGCRFVVRSVRGDVLADVRVDGWGTPDALVVPASARTVHVAVRPSDGVLAQIRLPATVASRRDRTAWPIKGPVSFDILGPTLLRLETWRQKGEGGATLTVTLRGEAGTTSADVVVDTLGDVRLPVEMTGPVEVTVRPSTALWLVPSIRVPRGVSREARDDRAWLDAGVVTPGPPPPAPPLTAAWSPPVGRPPSNPPLTAWLAAGIGTSDLDDLQPDPQLPPNLQGLFVVGLASRPVAETWWFDVFVRGDIAQAPVLSGDVLVEGLVVKRDWRLWVWGRAEVVRGLDPAAPMTTAVGALRITADAWPFPRWQLSGRLQGEARGILSGFWDPFVYGDQVRLWSDYKAVHRRSIEASARVRFYDPPWIDGAAEAWVLTNEDIFEPLEAYGATTWAEWSRPGLQVRGGFEIEHRLPDDDRNLGYWSPSVFLSSALTTWPDRDIGIQPRVSVRYRFYWQQLEVLFEVRAYMSRDRALRDIAPSRLPDAFAHEWYQDKAALRRIEQEPQ